MSIPKIIKLRGRDFKIFEKSIAIAAIGHIVFFNRPVTQIDAEILDKFILVGENNKAREIKQRFSVLFD